MEKLGRFVCGIAMAYIEGLVTFGGTASQISQLKAETVIGIEDLPSTMEGGCTMSLPNDDSLHCYPQRLSLGMAASILSDRVHHPLS